jgi:hypothetical protein
MAGNHGSPCAGLAAMGCQSWTLFFADYKSTDDNLARGCTATTSKTRIRLKFFIMGKTAAAM